MTSNLTAGERRWASARRTGMTVLGKVAVPKPLNLPSQRLENHGLDLNVEIVPKGTLGWGNRSSSSSNPWGSSTLSPNADGGASSVSQHNGRPLSAGSGSRPSTAGSDRTIERATNAWGPSSRPASASGVVPSNNQLSATSRPHSAETRPSSSQLSRFAEPLSEGLARALVTTAEKVQGVMSSESDRFSLASGDFPTLNSSKDSTSKSTELQDPGSHSCPSSASGKMMNTETSEALGSHSRPSSASGKMGNTGNTETPEADAQSGMFSSWNRDGPQNLDDGNQPGPPKWHGEPQQYHNANMPPPQFDAWRSPSGPAGVWYRGPPGGPPYRAQVGPGGFPIEPFPYYCPQIPGPPSANSQSVSGSGAGPRGHHHQSNGELYRPQMPDAFAHSGMPFGPSFYRGPMPYEGYYGHPMGYGNPTEREGPFKGMAGPSVHNRYSSPNAFDSGHSQSHHRHGRNDSTGKMHPELERSTRPGDGSWQGKMLSRQHNEWEGKENTETPERVPINKTLNPKRVGRTDVAPRTREWGAELDNEEDMYSSGAREVENISYLSGHDRVGLDSVAAASTPGMLQASAVMERGLVVPASARDSTLMQKIEVLNVKDRGSVEAYESNVLTKVGNDASVPYGKAHVSNTGAFTNERISNIRDRTSQQAFTSRRPGDHSHGKNSITVRGRLQSPDNHKSVATENISPSSYVHASNIQPAVADGEFSSGNNEDSSAETLDTKDSQAQRSKMRDFAKQRALQLQKEEEERIREQKAKALAKLEELNRRAESSSLGKSDSVLGPTEKEREEEQPCSEVSILGAKPEAAKPDSTLNFGDVSQLCVGTVPLGDQSTALAAHFPKDRTKAVTLEPVVSDGQSIAVNEEILKADASVIKGAPHLNEAGVSRHKRNSLKLKQNVQPSFAKEQLQDVFASDAQKDEADATSKENNLVPSGVVSSREESDSPRNTAIAAETPAQPRKKNYKSNRKHKPDEPAHSSTLPPMAVTETRPIKACSEIDNLNIHSDVDSCSAQGSVTVVGLESSKEQSSVHGEEVLGRVINQRKPQHPRRFPRNQQPNRPSDKFHGTDNVIWAPVKSQTKSDPEINQQTVQVSVTSAKSDSQVQSNTKGKRAEMERYVPKPVAKELAEQVSIQQPDTTSSGLPSDESTQRVGIGSQIPGGLETGTSATQNAAMDSREGNKQGKLHGAWRQRGLAETPLRGSSHFTSNTNKNARSAVGHYTVHTDAAFPVIATSVKDQIATVKGKRHSLKADKSLGSSHVREKNSSTMEADNHPTQFSDSDTRHAEKERVSSQWQPKSHPPTNNSHRGGRSSSGPEVAGERSSIVKKGFASQSRFHVISDAKEMGEYDFSESVDQSVTENKIPEMVNVGHQGHRKERRNPTIKGPSYSQNEMVFSSEGSADGQIRQQSSYDSRRGRNQNVHPRESHGDWGQESHRHNSHYEYHPVGLHNNRNAERIEDGTHAGPRYKDRNQNQNQSRRGRGNFHGRQSNSIRVDAGSS